MVHSVQNPTLTGANEANIRLTAHYRLHDIIPSHINWTDIPQQKQRNIRQLVAILEHFYPYYGKVKVTSSVRTHQDNVRVNGVPNSYHLITRVDGAAIDFTKETQLDTVKVLKDIYKFIIDNYPAFPFTQLILDCKDEYIHLAFASNNLVGEYKKENCFFSDIKDFIFAPENRMRVIIIASVIIVFIFIVIF